MIYMAVRAAAISVLLFIFLYHFCYNIEYNILAYSESHL